MDMSLKLFKSAGVPVSGPVHRLLGEANRARDGEAWILAAKLYGEALQRDPSLAHIWMQYGHALKESGDGSAAETAYAKASERDPRSAEPPLHRGHLRKQQGDQAAAGRFYLQAARLDPSNADALAELQQLMMRGPSVSAQDMLDLLDNDGGAPATMRVRTLERAMPGSDTAAVLVFDVSDLIAFFGDSRVPTGIQRVQIETITQALELPDAPDLRICCVAPDRDAWVEAPIESFLALCRLSASGGDPTAPDWTRAVLRLQLHLRTCEEFVFPPESRLVNLGTSWWIPNYFMMVRQAKASAPGVRYIPFVHDLIPLVAPECCAKGLIQDFIGWALGMYGHADAFLVNSEATKRDLLHFAEHLGHALDPTQIEVVRLDADSRKPAPAIVRAKVLSRLGLERTPFVLFVSTIEARKNHHLAFDAWIELLRRHGPGRTPKLVCVGKRGWLEATIYARLAMHTGLRDSVTIVSGLSDADMGELYRACLFTLYPSTHEGWGLPVTESLCWGKTPLTSNGSSLPEAGGPFAVYFEAGSGAALTTALETLAFDTDFRIGREGKIAQRFKPRAWSDISRQICAAAARPCDRPANAEDKPVGRWNVAQLGAYYGFGRNTATRLRPGMRSGEACRTGEGWWGQDDFGSWTKFGGGELEIAAAGPHGDLRLYLALRCPPNIDTGFVLEIEGLGLPVSGDLRRGEHRWVVVKMPAAPEGGSMLRITIRADQTEDLSLCTAGADRRLVSIGVAGFFVCEAEDHAARAALVEAIALNNLEELAASRPQPHSPPRSGLQSLV